MHHSLEMLTFLCQSKQLEGTCDVNAYSLVNSGVEVYHAGTVDDDVQVLKEVSPFCWVKRKVIFALRD